MARLDPRNPDSKETVDERYNPYNADTARDLEQQEKNTSAQNGDVARKDERGQPADGKSVDDAENTSNQSAPWRVNTTNNYTEPASFGERLQQIPKATLRLLKRRKGIAAAGIGGLIIAIGLAFLPLPLMPNFLKDGAVFENDSRSIVLRQRLIMDFEKRLSATKPCDNLKLYKCRKTAIPNSMLKRFSDSGIKPMADGKVIVATKKTGYSTVRPTHFEIPDGTNRTKVITAAEFSLERKNNPHLGRAVATAYNLSARSYMGKYMAKNFFGKFGRLVKNGGLAAAGSDLNETNARSKLTERLAAITKDTDGDANRSVFRDRFTKLFRTAGTKVSKTGGDPVLFVGIGACTALNLPQFIASSYRAIQVVQAMQILHETLLSPADMQKSGSLDYSSEKSAGIGKLLTEQVSGKDGGPPRSAVQSPVLLAAIGANKGKVSATKYLPGYEIYNFGGVKASAKLSSQFKDECSAIMSPQAMIASAVISTAISAGTLGTGAVVIGVLKVLGKLAVAAGAVQGAITIAEKSGLIKYVADTAYELTMKYAPNIYGDLRGEALGDALGHAIPAYFSLASLAGGEAPLTKNQATKFAQLKNAHDTEMRQQVLATLSPFDITSRYTPLGSIFWDMKMATTASSNSINTGVSTLGYILKSPLSLVQPAITKAASDMETRCDYAHFFDLDERLAINAGGYPCTGIPPEYITMPIDEVQTVVEDMVNPETGEPEAESDIALMMSDCSDGDLESISGCVIEDKSAEDFTMNICDEIDEKGNCIGEEPETSIGGSVPPVNGRERAALSLHMLDLQVNNIVDGTDDGEEVTVGSDSGGSESASIYEQPPNTRKVGRGWALINGENYSQYKCEGGLTDKGPYTNPATDITIRLCEFNGHNIASIISGRSVALFADAASKGVTMTVQSGHRTYEQQVQLWNAAGGWSHCRRYPNGSYTCQVAPPGTSNHESGIALDLGLNGQSFCFPSGATCVGNAGYDYMAKNGERYGFYKLGHEAWHWEMPDNSKL